MALSQGSPCPPPAPSDPTSVSPGGTELGGGVPTRLSCASQVWRSGTPARTRWHKCLQAARVRPQNDSSTGPACMGQIRMACDRGSPGFCTDARGCGPPSSQPPWEGNPQAVPIHPGQWGTSWEVGVAPSQALGCGGSQVRCLRPASAHSSVVGPECPLGGGCARKGPHGAAGAWKMGSPCSSPAPLPRLMVSAVSELLWASVS